MRIIDLPPSNPEPNPCEQLWDVIKDEIGNRVFATVEDLPEATPPALKRFREDAAAAPAWWDSAGCWIKQTP